jgi:hypothetical protein
MSLLIENSELAKVWNPQNVDDYMRKETCIFGRTAVFTETENNVDIPYNVDIVNKLETFYSIFVEKGGEYSLPVVTKKYSNKFSLVWNGCYLDEAENMYTEWNKYYSIHLWEHIASYYNTKLDAGIELPPKPEDRYDLMKRYSELFCTFNCIHHGHGYRRLKHSDELLSEFHELRAPLDDYLKKVREYNNACCCIAMEKIEIQYDIALLNFDVMSVSFEDAVGIFNCVKVANFGDNSIKESVVGYVESIIQSHVDYNLDCALSENELNFEKINDVSICEDILKLADWLMLPRTFTEWLYQQYSNFWKKQSKSYRRRNPIIFKKRLFLYGDAVCKLLDDISKSF